MSSSPKTISSASTLSLSWQSRGACRGLDPALFVPEEGATDEEIEQAKLVCWGAPNDDPPFPECPVRMECLRFAIETHAVGIWGGHTDAERRTLLRTLVRRISVI